METRVYVNFERSPPVGGLFGFRGKPANVHNYIVELYRFTDAHPGKG